MPPPQPTHDDVADSFGEGHHPLLAHVACRSPSRSRRFITVDTCQRPPRRVSMPRALSSPAIARRLVAPHERMSRRPARGHARAGRRCAKWPPERRTALPSPSSPSQRRRAMGLPSFTPRLLATASASLGPLRDRLPLRLRDQRHDPGESPRILKPPQRPRAGATDSASSAESWGQHDRREGRQRLAQGRCGAVTLGTPRTPAAARSSAPTRPW